MSVIRSLGAGIQTPAVNAVIPQLVPEEHLMRCNGINAAMQSAVQFAAPAAAGAIFAVSTLDTTLMIDIVTAILGIGLLSCLSVFLIYSGYEGRSELCLFPPYYRKASDPIWAFYLPMRSCGLPGRTFCAQKLWEYLLVPYRRGGDRLWRNDPGRDPDEP